MFYEIELFVSTGYPSKNNFVLKLDCSSKMKYLVPLNRIHNPEWGQKMTLPNKPGFFGSFCKTKILSIGNLQGFNREVTWFDPLKSIQKGHIFKTENFLIDTTFRKFMFGKKFELKSIFINNVEEPQKSWENDEELNEFCAIISKIGTICHAECFEVTNRKKNQDKSTDYEIILEYFNGEEKHTVKISSDQALNGEYAYLS